MEEKKTKFAAIILAAGSGSRMGITKTKQTLVLAGKTVIERCISAFDKADSVTSIVVVCREEELGFVNKECQILTKPYSVVKGGKCRAESAKLGFLEAYDNCDFVMIHDAARCLITPEEIDSVAKAAYEFGAATACDSVTDTIKKRGDDGRIFETVPRENLVSAKTPQAFSREIYEKALKSARKLDASVTDDNMLVEKIGIFSYCVESLPSNIKITTSYDLELAEFVLSKREKEV